MKKKISLGIVIFISLCFSHYMFYYFVATYKNQIKEIISWENEYGVSVNQQSITDVGTHQHGFKSRTTDLYQLVLEHKGRPFLREQKRRISLPGQVWTGQGCPN